MIGWQWLDGRPRDVAGLIFKLAGGGTRCLGPDWHDVEVLIDPAAEIRSGDIIRCVVAYSDGTRLDMLKELRWSRAARHWYLCAFDVNGEWQAAVTPNLVRLEFAQKVIARRPAGRPVYTRRRSRSTRARRRCSSTATPARRRAPSGTSAALIAAWCSHTT